MILVVYISLADTHGDRPYVYGPFDTLEIAWEWINNNKRSYLGRWYITRLITYIEP